MTSSAALAKDLRATWLQALWALLAPILLIVALRVFLIEPFVIPSGSMTPTLLVHDHIFAEKWAFGLHWPWQDKFFIQWSMPKRFEIVVFRYPKNPDVYFVKRVIGLPGDEISIKEGLLKINGEVLEQTLTEAAPFLKIDPDDRFEYFTENGHTVRYLYHQDSYFHTLKVPEGHLFMMGDNRDQSSDSRVWGFVPIGNLVGRVQRVWLSCSETLPSANYICNPQTLRWERIWTLAR